ncbi:hypothetical protein [Vibrio parahaemolyticus]|uniref:hypothetical protein n=1 Tax=Vibrio parahaemolyticus TaxID=670 RepID=UPI00112142B8|nr:hypothetical protein [Vibrio parahaemolyticus]TOM76524.1 hypothetical protein CGH70_24310 [Vibrio parahaemolyticus]
MNTKEIEAQEMFHKISERLEALTEEFSKFNAEQIGNIDSRGADEFREKLVELENEADRYFKQFCYAKNRVNS